jgi:hypothetical protein
MTMTDTYLAIFTGSKNNPRMQEWMGLPEAERKAREKDGIAAWKAWMEQHQGILVGAGGPLGKTKRVSPQGIADISNQMSGYVLVRAASHEAAAGLFENHPHFTKFPGESVEIMPVLPIPGA